MEWLYAKKQADKLIKKAKQLNLIKPLEEAFDNTPCEKEIHKGKIEYFQTKKVP